MDRKDTGEPERLLRDLRMHQIELETQNQALRESQLQLEESRARYQDLYDFAPIAYFTFDRKGVILDVNLTGASLLGKVRAKLVGVPFFMQVRMQSLNPFTQHLKKAFASSGPVTCELALSTDRGPMELHLVSAAVRDAHGAAHSCRTALLDITQQRAAERQARAAEARARALSSLERIDQALHAVSAALTRPSSGDLHELLQVIVEEARVVVEARYAGLGIAHGSGLPFEPWVHSGLNPEEAKLVGETPRAVGLLGAVVEGGKPIRLRDPAAREASSGLPAGHPRMRSFLGVPIRYDGQNRGNLYLIDKTGGDEFSEEDELAVEMLADRVGVAMEIARLRQFEARETRRFEFLARAGPLLAATIDYEPTLEAIAHLVVPHIADLSAIELFDEHGSVTRIVAYHPDASKRDLLLRLVGTTSVERLQAEVRAAVATRRPQLADPGEPMGQVGATCTILAPLLLRDRAVGVLRLAMAESGRRYGDEDVSLAQEIADHAVLAIERARLYQQGQIAIGARDNLLSVVAHDLRNYLLTIRMSAERLSLEEGPAAPSAKRLETITRTTRRMEQLIASLRDATMIETGQLTVTAQAEEVAALVDEAYRTLEPQADAHSVSLRIDIPDRLPAVRCDRERILQVLTNLVGNAIKFTGAGGEICVSARADGGVVRLAVGDTGHGITEEERAHLFERSWKGALASPGSGTGLGLYIAKGIIEAHGGRIWAESTVGVGSTFTFTLPVASPLEERAPDFSAPHAQP